MAGYTFSYADALTPTITDVVPSASIGNKNINFYGYHRITNFGDGLRDPGEIVGVWTGNAQCGLLDIVQNTVTSANDFARIKCLQAREQEAGKYNVSEQLIPGHVTKTWRMQRASLIR